MQYLMIAALLALGPQNGGGGNPPTHQIGGFSSFKTLEANDLIEWQRQGKSFTLVDARNKENMPKDPLLHWRKTWVPFDTEDDQIIKSLLPSKSATIVVFCCNRECGASGLLAERLVKMGYENIYVLPEGCDVLKRMDSKSFNP